MSSFCRITGNARNLPKPCYFPLLPPISPADAKKLCRITGKAQDVHHYSPVIAFGKPYRFDGKQGCRITQFENLSFTKPIFVKYKDNENSFDNLTELMTKMKTKRKKKVDTSKLFVYKLSDQSTGLVLPPELEEAIRTGEVENLSVSKDIQHITIKRKQGRIIKIKMEPVEKSELDEESCYYGEGQSQEVLEDQQKVLNERNKRKQETMARKRLFEQKEQKAEEEERKATERPKPKRPPVKFDPLKRKAKLDSMNKMIEEQRENTSIILPALDEADKARVDEQIWYEKMLEDISKAQVVSVNIMTVISTNFDFSEIEQAESAGFDWDLFPKEEVCEPVEVENVKVTSEDITNIPNAKTLPIAASVETVDPSPPVDGNLIEGVKKLKDSKLKYTENVADKMKDMNSNGMIPDVGDIAKIVFEEDNYIHGYLVEGANKGAASFIKKEDYKKGKGKAISGALVMLENNEKFVTGQIIHLADEETFVAGQTFETPNGKKFIPGHSIVDTNGEVNFIPGITTRDEEKRSFVAGRIIDKNEKSEFMAGQMIDRGDRNPVFVSGQTIVTDSGMKFVPGESYIDKEGYQEFVPGITLPTSQGEMFIPGQVFDSEEGIKFTPGQIICTDEGPSFIPGRTVKNPEGDKKFVKGEMVNEDGKIAFKNEPPKLEIPEIIEDLIDEPKKDRIVIPNDDLQLVAVVGKNISGFIVKPSNTSNIQAGEKLLGNIVETDDSVLFYLNGKLPNNVTDECKIISGQLNVDETCQRFIPGKIFTIRDDEKFVPGQMVKTNQGEEFIPGQFIETTDGPKFVPGQSVVTGEGEKFIPGQVIMEEDGPKFVPGQIIQTKNGATFIPGQMMSTEEGQKFVPGQLVDTKDGPRFVPGQVIETNEGPQFVSGTVVETEEGLKYLPNDSNMAINIEEFEEDSEAGEISFQGFDVSPEELQLISQSILSSHPHMPITKEKGLIDSCTLKKLAADTMEVHGRTPEPNIEKRKKKKKKGKITIDALDDGEDKEEIQIEDSGTNKVQILRQLIKVGSTMSSVEKEKELEKLNELLNEVEKCNENETEVEAMKYISSKSPQEDLFELYIGNDEQLIEDILLEIEDVYNVSRNDEVTNLLNDAIRKGITKKCDQEIKDLINKIRNDPECLFTDSAAQILLTQAVGIVCVTGDIEVATLLEQFISEPTNPECLQENKDVVAVLRQLLVLNRMAERNNEVASMLQDLQDDPEGIKDRNKVRRFIKKAKSLLVKEKKAADKPFDVRHVTSSKDIPKEIFEQIKEDTDEAKRFMEKLPDELFKAIMGDDRCGGKLLESLDDTKTEKSSKDIERFKKGMAVVVAKNNVQAVIPRHFARSIYYGIMPYLLIDEEGYKFFERGLTGRKLAPSRLIENTWYQPDSFYDKSVLFPQQRVTPSGMQYNLIFLGNSYRKSIPSLQYTSLLPSSGPTRISYLESQRRASREGSITPLRRSSRSNTPSRRFSVSSLHDHFPSTGDSFVRRNSSTLSNHNLSRGRSPIETSTPSINYGSYGVANLNVYNEPDTPLCRSGTVGKLLDKYSKVSLAKEFGYRKPIFSRYQTFGDTEENGDIEENGIEPSVEDRYPPSNYLRSSKQPEVRGLYDDSTADKVVDKDFDIVPQRESKRLLRPFSDIYETDELESPTSPVRSPLRSNLIETAKRNYDAVSSLYEPPRPAGSVTRGSYTDRLREWKSKQNDAEGDTEDYTPTKISHNRYESVLTGEDDSPYESSYKPRKPYTSSVVNDEEDDDDEFSLEKFRSELRKKYGHTTRDRSQNLDFSHERPTASRFSRGGKQDLEDEDDLSYSRRPKPYSTAKDDSSTYSRYKKRDQEEGDDISLRRNEPHETANDAYGGGYGYPYNYGTGQPSPYGQPLGYGPSHAYDPYSMYGYPPSTGRSYGPPLHGGAGMSMYSSGPPGITGPSSRYGGGYGSTSSPYSRFEADTSPDHRPVAYGSKGRRFTAPVSLPSDDEDEDIKPYEYKRDQRNLASKIARKYVGDYDDDDD